jgi:hypothetical protein
MILRENVTFIVNDVFPFMDQENLRKFRDWVPGVDFCSRTGDSGFAPPPPPPQQAADRLKMTLICRVTWPLSEGVNLYSRQALIQPRKTYAA